MTAVNRKRGLSELLMTLNPDISGPLLILKCMYPWLDLDVPNMPPKASAEEMERQLETLKALDRDAV